MNTNSISESAADVKKKTAIDCSPDLARLLPSRQDRATSSPDDLSGLDGFTLCEQPDSLPMAGYSAVAFSGCAASDTGKTESDKGGNCERRGLLADLIRRKARQCGAVVTVLTHDVLCCGAKVLVPVHCGKRFLCVRCGRAYAVKTMERVGVFIGSMSSPKMLTLTYRNKRRGKLKTMLQELDAAFRRLRRSALRGLHGVAGRGCTFNEEAQSWHCHFHLVINTAFLPFAALRDAWRRCTHGQGGLDVRAVSSVAGVAREIVQGTAKKGCKGGDIERLRVQGATIMDEYLEAMHGRQAVFVFGKRGGLPKVAKPVCRCPRCGEVFRPKDGSWLRDTIDAEAVDSKLFGYRWKDYFEGFAVADDA